MSAMSRAIRFWRSGRTIPLTLFAALADEGYDVEALERRYRKDT